MKIDDKIFDTIYVYKRDDWRDWLKINHIKKKEIWLIYYKKHTVRKRIPYDDAVEEAICYGWIDTTVRRIDEERYMQKYMPRKKNSKWSEINKKRALKMIESGKIKEPGIKKINEAKENGNWNNAYGSKEKQEIPEDLLKALKNNNKALNNFLNFAPGYQNNYIYRINDAKREDTRKRRIAEIVDRAFQNLKPGMT